MKFLRIILVACALFFLLIEVKTPYLLLIPGTAEDVLPLISVPGKPRASGHLYLTTVYVSRADALLYLFGVFDPHAKLMKDEGMSQSEEDRIETIMMQESQLSAELVALQRAGYPATLQGTGVRVIRIVTGSHAAGLLKAGDVIEVVNGHPTPFARDLLAYLTTQQPGKNVVLVILEGGKRETVRVQTIPSPSGKGARLGILVASNGVKLKSPVAIHIKVNDIEGSSAGLMFALGSYDLLKGGNLFSHLSVAGTGTIDPDGKVGAIEGIQQKIVAARSAGAQYFLCPVQNYEEARAHPDGLVVQPVRNFDQALAYLSKLQAR